MAQRTLNRLTPAFVTTAKRGKAGPGMHADGGNLYLQVTRYDSDQSYTTASWIFRYMIDGRSRDMGLGPLSVISLAKARDMAAKFREMLVDGVDPLEQRQQEREQRRKDEAAAITFREAATEWLALYLPTFKNKKHRAQVDKTIRDTFAKIGSRPVRSIDAEAINAIGTAIREDRHDDGRRKDETADRVEDRIKRIKQWVEDGKPSPKPKREKRHHPALPYTDAPAFMAALRQEEGVSARALEFLLVTGTRPGAVRGATWAEIDLGEKVWTVPVKREGTKLTEDHRVPLSDRAVELLTEIRDDPRWRGREHLFPSDESESGYISDGAMKQVIQRMHDAAIAEGGAGWVDPKEDNRMVTPHGTARSTFRDWVRETTDYSDDVGEMALAHTIKNKVKAAYARGDLFDKRRALMADWERYLDGPVGGNVVPLSPKRKGRA